MSDEQEERRVPDEYADQYWAWVEEEFDRWAEDWEWVDLEMDEWFEGLGDSNEGFGI